MYAREQSQDRRSENPAGGGPTDLGPVDDKVDDILDYHGDRRCFSIFLVVHVLGKRLGRCGAEGEPRDSVSTQ